MRPLIGYFSLIALVAVTVPAAAQTHDSTDADRRQASLVLDHTFSSAIGEPVRVFLAKDATYHAELQGGGLQLQLKTLLASQPTPLIEPLLAGQGAGGTSIYVIKPNADGVYIFTTLGGDAAHPVSLHLYAVKPGDKKKP